MECERSIEMFEQQTQSEGVAPPQDLQRKQKLIILVVIGLFYSIGVSYLIASVPSQRFRDDLFVRWYASRMLLTSGRSLYDPANASDLHHLTPWPDPNQFFHYPAYLFIITGPLSLLPYQAARVIWAAFGLWCLWLGIVIFVQSLKPGWSINRLTGLLVLITLSVPVMQHVIHAQFNTPGLLALALGYRALSKKKFLQAGLWTSGLLFKPQTILLLLFILLAWSAFKPERRLFWVGLALGSFVFWAIAELFEPNWIISFWRQLDTYVPISSVLDRLWNPHQILSLTLILLTIWFTFYLRHFPANSIQFRGLVAWTIMVNALIIPIFGMLHIVLVGPVFVILLNGLDTLYPTVSSWFFKATIGLFVAGLVAFIIPLLLTGTSGFQITSAEAVYRFTMPIVLSLASLPLIFDHRRPSLSLTC
jgi:hypothetical protein